MNYAIITENDISNWNNSTGNSYHFPKNYLKLLHVGTKVIYYKGTLKDKTFVDQRLASKPHYFGICTIGHISIDPQNSKKYYAAIEDYIQFNEATLAKQGSNYLEKIPDNKKTNYWRNGVRAIDEATYNKILNLSLFDEQDRDINIVSDHDFISYKTEGKKTLRFTSAYERIPANREAAIAIHGYNCKACNFNFEEVYGNLGKDFIHVHHIKPISETGEMIINPLTDLVPLCPNCHSMIHKQRMHTLSVEELVEVLGDNLKHRLQETNSMGEVVS